MSAGWTWEIGVVGVTVIGFVAPLPVEINAWMAGPVSALVHIGAYAMLTCAAANRYRARAGIVAAGILVLSFLLEGTQALVPSRYFGMSDLLANALGVAIGLILARGLSWSARKRAVGGFSTVYDDGL